MSATKNYIYDKSIELAKDLQKKCKTYDPFLADEIHDMVTISMVDEGMTLAQALDEVKIKYMVANS